MPSSVELKRLKYFIALSEELHFGRAAERLYIAQPPLSIQIRKLEEELGICLFERTSRSVRLTEAGRTFQAGVQRAMEEIERALHAAKQVERGLSGHLLIGFISSGGVTFLPKLLRHLKQVLPHLQPELRQYSSDGALDALASQRMDLALVRTSTTSSGLLSRTIHRDPAILALPIDHPLAHSKKLTLRELAEEMFVLYPPNEGHAAYNLVQRACIKAGFVPRASEFVDDVFGILGLVAAGLGIAIMPQSVSLLNVSGVVFHHLPDLTENFELSVVWREDDTRPLVQRVIQEICTDWLPESPEHDSTLRG